MQTVYTWLYLRMRATNRPGYCDNAKGFAWHTCAQGLQYSVCLSICLLPPSSLLSSLYDKRACFSLIFLSLVPRPHPIFQCCTKTVRPDQSGDVIGPSLECPPRCMQLTGHVCHVHGRVGGYSKLRPKPRPINYQINQAFVFISVQH